MRGLIGQVRKALTRRAVAPASEVVLARAPTKIYMLPTREGFVFALLLLALLIASLNYGLGLGFLICFLLAAIAIVSLLHAQRNLADIAVSVSNAPPVFAGDVLRFPVRFANRSPRSRFALGIEQGPRRQRVRAMLNELYALMERDLALTLPALRRGEWPAPDFTVTSAYPLGLTRSFTRRIQPAARALVYPRPDDVGAAQRALSLRAGASGPLPDGDDFLGLRDWRPEDPPRRVDWKAAARGKGLKTKLFGGNESPELWLDFDALAPLDAEARLSRLAALVIAAEQAERRYGLRLPGEAIAPSRGLAHYHRALTALALFPAETAGPRGGHNPTT